MLSAPSKNPVVGSARFVVVVFLWTAALMEDGSADELHRKSATLMGTRWHLALYSPDTQSANAAFRDALRVIKDIDTDLSNYSADSELSQLCRSAPHAQPVSIGDHLWTVLNAAIELSAESEGAFDVTIGPVSKLWRRARRKKQLPDPGRLNEARAAVGFQFIRLREQPKSVQLMQPGMQLDLGGIAKGYAVDKAVEAIEKHGIQRIMVNGGGDLLVTGPPAGALGWEIDLAGLNPSDPRRKIVLKHAAVATSGDAWQFVEIHGRRYSHLIDPKTGLGSTVRTAASVIAHTCMTADSLASAICVLPPEQGLALTARHESSECRLIVAGRNGVLKEYVSDGFPPAEFAASTDRGER